MSILEVKTDPLAEPIDIYYEDVGSGFPIVLIHGWPFDHSMWREQRDYLVNGGCRVITYDRRGFGQSSKPLDGYHYNQFAADLNALMEALDLSHATLVGYSMGAGDVIRYMLQYFGQRVSQVALISGITPSLMESQANPAGVAPEVLDAMKDELQADPDNCLQQFFGKIFDENALDIISGAGTSWTKSLSVRTSPQALVESFKVLSETDFADEMHAIADVPTLIVHGTTDEVAPIEATALRAAKILHRGVFKAYDDAPHGLFVTHAAQLNEDILSLVKDPPSVTLPLDA